MARRDTKYELKDLHQEIDYYDRKIAYCQTLEPYATEDARAEALKKLVTKRETLVKEAKGMAERGVEFDEKYLPRSFRAAAGEVAS